jgi:tetratricopeptide (TPR) repeat protein
MQWWKALALAPIVVLLGCATVSERDLARASMHRRLAESKLQKGALELAIREYRASIEFYDKDPEAHFGLADAYRRKGLYAESEQSLLRTLKLDKTHNDARLNLSVVYGLQARWADVIRITTQLVDEPTFLRPSRALVNRGWAHYKSGSLDLAQRDLSEALISDEGNHQAHLNLGILLFDRGSVLDAMVHFEKVLKILERRPPAFFSGAKAQTRFHLAQAHVKLGQRAKAIEQLRAASEQGGKGEWAEKSREYLSVLE